MPGQPRSRRRVLKAPEHLTRADKRRLARLSKELDRFLETDRLFFRRRPDRTCRLRRAHRAELETFARVSGRRLPQLPPGRAWFMLVAQVRPGARMRHPLAMPSDIETDLSEDEAVSLRELCLSGNPALAESTQTIEAAAKE
jgi:hypothetical protein